MKATFHIHFNTIWGQQLYIYGSTPELGKWNKTSAIPLTYEEDGRWSTTVELSSDIQQFEYRYFVSANRACILEEWNRNHRIGISSETPAISMYDLWQQKPSNLPLYSSAFTDALFTHYKSNNQKALFTNKQFRFKIWAPKTRKDETVVISGNIPELGNWNPNEAQKLSYWGNGEWRITFDTESLQFPFEYKFAILNNQTNEIAYWETGDNRIMDLTPSPYDELTIVSGLIFQENQKEWKGAGIVLPLFSIRSEESFGIGDFGDLKKLCTWATSCKLSMIQILPINDTSITHTWTDSYPYNANSVFALHPIYCDLKQLPSLKSESKTRYFEELRQKLNKLDAVDYEAVNKAKQKYLKLTFDELDKKYFEEREFIAFINNNSSWLFPYAAYMYFGEKYSSSETKKWKKYAEYNKESILLLVQDEPEAQSFFNYIYFVQYELHKQLLAASEHAKDLNIVLKGDIPIGVSRQGCDVWCNPELFNLNGQAGAPPDDFAANGQNWGFPTYNWSEMQKDNYAWWQQRLLHMSQYFEAYRIDHILGFFRIWEIPINYLQGICGHFVPSLPLSSKEINDAGFKMEIEKYTTPRIHEKYLHQLFGPDVSKVKKEYLIPSLDKEYWKLSTECNTQRKIKSLFSGKQGVSAKRIAQGLMTISNEVLFVRDSVERILFHPRILASQTFMYDELGNPDKFAFDQLYWDFFYRRHNEFWKENANKQLTPIISATNMLVCGEDLGMIPDSVPDVMHKLQILSLELERMPKMSKVEFSDPATMPYYSVCTTSTHDMPPIRNWWKEDPERRQRYYNQILKIEGEAPEECTPEVCRLILAHNFDGNSMWAVFPFQDLISMSDQLRNEDISKEQINYPDNPHHYWNYRTHITVEELISSEQFNTKLRKMILQSDR